MRLFLIIFINFDKAFLLSTFGIISPLLLKYNPAFSLLISAQKILIFFLKSEEI